MSQSVIQLMICRPALLCLQPLAITLCLMGAWGASAWAQGTSSASPTSVTPNFAIRGFEVKGDNPLSSAQTSAVLAPFLRNDATIDTLQKATSALETALRDAGHGLHKVALPPQDVGDKVSLEIVKFTIGRVQVSGQQHFNEANIRASLPELAEGASPNFKTLAVQTALANDNPSKQVTVSLKVTATGRLVGGSTACTWAASKTRGVKDLSMRVPTRLMMRARMYSKPPLMT